MRKRPFRTTLRWVLLGLLVIAPGAARASSEPLRIRVDRLVIPFVEAGNFQGVVAVRTGEQAPLVLSYGRSSVELAVSHRPEDIFMIGSISKQFTAAAILLLEEDGLLSTEDKVSRHLPGFRHGDSVTIQELLTHTSGIADIYSLESFGQTSGQRGVFQDVITELGRMELTHTPGSRYLYSNGGYAVLAAVIEKVSGRTYGEFLEQRIFRPLAMSASSHDTPGPARVNRVPGYDPWGRTQVAPVRPVASAFSTGSGSIWSSAEDLMTWTTALHTGKLLGAESYAKMTRDYGNGYGFGVSIFRRFGRKAIGHDGRIRGYASDLAWYPEDRMVVVILSNVESNARDEIRYLVAAAALEQPHAAPERPVLGGVKVAGTDEFIGVYSFGPAFNVFITLQDGRVMARANGGGASELVPSSDSEFFSRMLYTYVRFGRNESGEVDRVIWGKGEGAPVGRRVR